MSLNLSSYQYAFNFKAMAFDIPGTSLTFNFAAPMPALVGFGSVFIYLFCIYILFPAVAPNSQEGKELLRNGSKIHFAMLFLYSATSCFATVHYVYSAGELFSLNDYLCNPVPGYIRLISFTFTLSKIWEWGDTAIDIWRGKSPAQIGFLHCYHHATTFLLFLIVTNFPGTEKSGMIFNGFVHTLMYYHYAFRLPKAVRPIITALQLVQLGTVTYFWHVTPSTCSAYTKFPQVYTIEFLLPYAMVPVYGIFFVRFFLQSYVFKKANKNGKRN